MYSEQATALRDRWETLLLCLYRHPSVTPDVPRLGVVRDDLVVDVHLASLVSMIPHMKLKRAQEIASALAPPDMLAFLEGGRHSWNALTDSLVRLGASVDIGLEGPAGEAVVLLKGEVRLTPLVPPAAGWSGEALGEWSSTPVASPGSRSVVALHTDGQAYLPEYLAVVGPSGGEISVEEAIEHIALVAVVRPSRPETACPLYRPPAAPEDEPELVETITKAVSAASRTRALYTGDIVRCGPAMVTRAVDLRRKRVDVDLSVEDIVPSR